MPVIKNALARYRVIDRSLRNEYNPFPSKAALRSACEEELFGTTLGGNICASTIEKDLFAMRLEHDAPIKYSKARKRLLLRRQGLFNRRGSSNRKGY